MTWQEAVFCGGDALSKKKKSAVAMKRTALPSGYASIHNGIVALLDDARHTVAYSVNALMTASYWDIGRRVIEAEQKGRRRAGYGEQLIARLSNDLTARFGRGFSVDNLENMRRFFLTYSRSMISETVSRKSGKQRDPTNSETLSRNFELTELAQFFTLPWSAYVRLLSVKDAYARQFYETEALQGGWSVRQLDRQISSQFYERTALSRDKAAMLVTGSIPKQQDIVTPNEAIKDPYVLEFLDLKDEYSESDLEEALIHRLEDFLLELGDGFTFIGRQRRLRIDQTWYRVDLLFFHRQLRCLVIVDLKLGSLTHGDVGQMHMYCNYAKEHWTLPDENPPVGLILCADRGHALARYALEGLPTKVMAANFRTVLPNAELLQEELENTQRMLASRGVTQPVSDAKK